MAKVNFSKINVTSLGAFAYDVISTIDNSGIKELIDSKKFNILRESYQTYSNSLYRSLKSTHTAAIRKSEAERIRLMSGINSRVKTGTKSPDQAESSEAILLYGYIKNICRNFGRFSGAERTSRVSSLLRILEDATFKNAIEIMRLDIWINPLSNANTAFEAGISARSNEIQKIHEKPSASKLRNDIAKAIVDMMEYINALNIVNPTDELKKLKRLIEFQNNKLAMHFKKKWKSSSKKNESQILVNPQ